MRITNVTATQLGKTKTDLIYQVEAIEEGRLYSGWPNEGRRIAFELYKHRLKEGPAWLRCNNNSNN
jgi:hypothetical protein